MEFNVGDLVWVTSACSGDKIGPPAIIINSYEDLPKIFMNNENANAHWLETEDIGVGRVYDLLYEGQIEEAVLGEWLKPLDEKS
tara:strand:+ start:995 stop:1246 length:252 start_codon:yes stop_codon:yes gene_type:complete